jgi:hypothetical protein
MMYSKIQYVLQIMAVRTTAEMDTSPAERRAQTRKNP